MIYVIWENKHYWSQKQAYEKLIAKNRIIIYINYNDIDSYRYNFNDYIYNIFNY